MALEIKKIKVEKVLFGDFEATPHMTQEKKLRVSQLKLTAANQEKAMDVLASCFGDDKEVVKEFMKENMFLDDLARLQVYLLRGDAGLAELEARLEKMEDKRLDRALEEMAAEKEEVDE